MLYHFTAVKKYGTSILDEVVYGLSKTGWLGVDLFFVLSGFLITGILLRARGTSKSYFKSFYVRRILRIFPLYYAYLFLFFVLLPIFADQVFPAKQLAQLEGLLDIQAWFWLYASNIYSFLQGDHTGLATSHFWSLAIEEQFYLVWPLIVFAFSGPTLRKICIGLIGIAFGLRVALYMSGYDPVAIYVFSPTRMDTLLSGALLAIWVHEGADTESLLRLARRVLIVLGPIAVGILWVGGQHPANHPAIFTIGYSIFAFCFASMVAIAVLDDAPGRYRNLLTTRPLRFLGKYSYGLYVIHVLVFAIGSRAFGDPVVIFGTQLIWQLGFTLACLSATLIGALVSWHVMEKRFLQLKDRFEY
jgi:peptidoglycan/LPS O-acetylase OafA/YrhL